MCQPWDAAEHTVTAPLVVMELHIQMGRWTFFKGITMQVITVNEGDLGDYNTVYKSGSPSN